MLQVGRLGGLFGEGQAHQSPHRGDGTEYHQTIWAVKFHSYTNNTVKNIHTDQKIAHD